MMDMVQVKQNAIDWACGHIGKLEYVGWCLAFIEDAVEKSNGIELFGGDCAQASAALYQDGMREGVPEAGTFVFYDCTGTADGQTLDWGTAGYVSGTDRWCMCGTKYAWMTTWP